ncbi:MAG TPA: helix-turn-helix domain-containing protein, partial [Steroidobacteraceae bacterium]|nr:helix-turn-helix domain-containing protein [Steroidobacteraceae bacterium]
MDERLRFVARLLDGEKMAVLCREFDISRKTGYKIFQRYKDTGLEGLTDHSRRPYRQANLGCSQDPRKAAAAAIRGSVCPPSARCTRCWIGTGLSAAAEGLATGRRNHARAAQGAERSVVHGLQGRVHARRSPLLLPLTITHAASRYLLCCDALSSTKEASAFTVFERTFKDFGLPVSVCR